MSNADSMSKKLSEGISDAITKVVSNREEYYKDNPLPDIGSVEIIIQSYSNKNAAISGGAGIIPGPLGMAAAVPEILFVTKNQIEMIYDVAKAHGHDAEKISKELIVGILFGAMGQGATALFVVQGQKVMAKRVGARALQNVIALLGGKITQQAAKSMAAKWFPVAGAIAMASWSKYSTKKIGNKAKEIFSKEIEIIMETEDGDISVIEIEVQEPEVSLEKTKIEILINLMKIDGKIDDQEVKFIESFLEQTDLSSDDKIELIGKLNDKAKMKIDYAPFKEDKEEALQLLIDLIALAKCDEQFHITEKMFIKEISKNLGFDENDLIELMDISSDTAC